MTSLCLKFQEKVLQEVVLSGGVVTIGRQPDNLMRIDNPIVSGHHAKIYWEAGRYFLEDLESFNGTYVNHQPVRKAELKDGDALLIGKHMIEFHETEEVVDGGFACLTCDRVASWQAEVEKSRPPQLETTMVVDTNKVKEMLAKMSGGAAGDASSRKASAGHSIRLSGIRVNSAPAGAGNREIGTVTIVAGRTHRQKYVLSSKLSVIGKSSMASIRLKRWFAPRIAASIHQRGDGYFLVAAGGNIRIRVNNHEVTNGQQELKGGDQFEVAGITAQFGFEKG